MPFFTNPTFQPKRNFRFQVSFSGLGDDLTYMVTSVNKPGFTVGSTAHRFLNHQFNFPNIVTWDDVNVSFIDAVDPNVGSTFYRALLNSGYVNPSTIDRYQGALTKRATTDSIGLVKIRQLDGGEVLGGSVNSAGTPTQPQIIDEWTLINSMILSVKFGEAMSYTDDGMVNVAISLKYDYAEYATNQGTIA